MTCGLEKTLKDLEDKGYTVLKIKNTWLDDLRPYKGINVHIEAPSGQMFELQFHTPESFEMKNGVLHNLYEQRRCTVDVETIAELDEKMFRLSDKLTNPEEMEK